MTQVELALRQIAAALEDLGVSWALIGGLAVSARAEPRLTRDVDVAVAVAGNREAERLVADLRARGYDLEMTLEQTAVDRLSTVRLRRGDSSALVDLLFASSGIEPEIVAAAEPIAIEVGLTVPVATRAHLIALKLLSRDDARRYQDAVDLDGLVAHASPAELDLARSAVKLIARRGYHRGRDLEAALDELVGARRP